MIIGYARVSTTERNLGLRHDDEKTAKLRPPSIETSHFQRGKLASMSDVTRILSAIEQGDPPAAEQLLPLVYDELCKLDELLTRLGEEDAVAARVAHLHLFGGLSVEEAGEVLGLSRAVAYRNWKYARAWLREALEK